MFMVNVGKYTIHGSCGRLWFCYRGPVGFRQVLGEDHPDTLVAQANFFALMEAGKEAEGKLPSRELAYPL